MARHDQDICPRLPPAFARVLDGRGASLALDEQRVAEFANGPLHGRANSDLRLEGDGAEVGKQPMGHIPSLRCGPAALFCVEGFDISAINFHADINIRLSRSSRLGSLAFVGRYCRQERRGLVHEGEAAVRGFVWDPGHFLFRHDAGEKMAGC